MVWHHDERMQVEEIWFKLAAPERFHHATSDAGVGEPHRSDSCLAKLAV